MSNSNNTETIKLPAELVQKVRKIKEKTGVPIATYVSKAVEEKLKKEVKK